MLFSQKQSQIPTPDSALKGRAEPIPTAETHFVNGRPLKGPYPDGNEKAIFGLGCFWGAERKLWQLGDGDLDHGLGLRRRLHAQSNV